MSNFDLATLNQCPPTFVDGLRSSMRAKAVLHSAVLELLGGDADHPTAAVETVAPQLGPGERADTALVVELVVERIEANRESGASEVDDE